MVKSTLIGLLKTFSEEEWKRFALFLRSPYFNRSKGVERLFTYISRFRPRMDNPRLSKENSFRFVYGNKAPYRESKVNDLMYKLKGLAEEFLAHNELKSNPTLQEQQLAYLLSRRKGAYAQFIKATERAARRTQQQVESMEKHWALLWLNHLAHHHPEQETPYNSPLEELRTAMGELDQLYLYAKFRYSTELLSRKKILQEEPDILLLNACFEVMAQGFSGHSLLKLHYLLARLNAAGENHKAYQEAKGCFRSNLNQMGPIEKLSAFFNLLNYVIRQANTGDVNWRTELFEWYETALEKGFLLSDGFIHDATFLNIVINAAILKKFKFAREFIIGYQDHLHPGIKEQATSYCRAYLLVHERRYDEANELLMTTTYTNQLYKTRYHSLLIRCRYEFALENDDFKEFLANSCKKFRRYMLKECQWAEEKRQSYLNWIDMVETLAAYRNDGKKGLEYQEELRSLLEQQTPIFLKEWLLEKIATLDSM